MHQQHEQREREGEAQLQQAAPQCTQRWEEQCSGVPGKHTGEDAALDGAVAVQFLSEECCEEEEVAAEAKDDEETVESEDEAEQGGAGEDLPQVGAGQIHRGVRVCGHQAD